MHRNDHSDLQIAKNERALRFSIIMVSIMLSVKFIGAHITHSLALFSDSCHLVTDLASLLISWSGLKLAARKADSRFTFGYYRFSILSALINNLLLIGVSFFILFQTFQRYVNPLPVESCGMIIIAIVGLLINLTIIVKLRTGQKNLNIKSVFLHFMGDTLADLGVLIGGLIIGNTGWYGIDTILSALLSCLIFRSASTMAIECVKILLESAPQNINIKQLKESLCRLPGVVEITDLHIWSLSLENVVLTAHVSVVSTNVSEISKIIHQIQQVLYEHFNIVHSTIQVEYYTCESGFHSKSGIHGGKRM
jgi:cobalt-zinc-cadmium efflux system protein